MANQPNIFLAAAGPINGWLGEFPCFEEGLRVVALRQSVAARVANRLGGRAARWEDLGEAEVLVVSGPEAAVPDLLGASRAAAAWVGKVVIGWDTDIVSFEIEGWLPRAEVATCRMVCFGGLRAMVVEGSEVACGVLRQMTGLGSGRFFEVSREGKGRVLGALRSLTSEVGAMIQEKTETLVGAGLRPVDATGMVRGVLADELRKYPKKRGLGAVAADLGASAGG
jgi:hypothetical protein